MSAIHEIQKAALALPLEQRVLLAESLLGSLPPVSEEWTESEEMTEVIGASARLKAARFNPCPREIFGAGLRLAASSECRIPSRC